MKSFKSDRNEVTPPCWLVAEDCEDDFLLLRRACGKLKAAPKVFRCKDGAEAMAYLLGKGVYGDRQQYPFPDLIISDVKMARCDGFTLLRLVKEENSLAAIPFLLMSASSLECDRRKAQELGADDYLIKPGSSVDLVRTVESVAEHYRVEAA